MNKMTIQAGLPFDDIKYLFKVLPARDEEAVRSVQARQNILFKPQGSLGRLEEIVEWLAGWQGKEAPTLNRPVTTIFAGNHGIVNEGVSAWPQHLTRDIMEKISAGGAAVNQICKQTNSGLKVFDLALDIPTRNFTQEAALEEAACAATIAFGMEAVSGGADIICLGEIGIGNTTSAAAIYYALYGGQVGDWVGRGAGADDAQIKRKINIVQRGVDLHGSYRNEPLEILRRLGGRETAAMCGAILAARTERVPIILDGYSATAAAAILYAIDPDAISHCIAGHVSNENGHRKALEKLGLHPLLDLDLRLGEASGAALAFNIVQAALKCWSDMETISSR